MINVFGDMPQIGKDEQNGCPGCTGEICGFPFNLSMSSPISQRAPSVGDETTQHTDIALDSHPGPPTENLSFRID
jgi:hypothetical protein